MLVYINTDRHQFTSRNNCHAFFLGGGFGSNTAMCEQNVYVKLCFNVTGW